MTKLQALHDFLLSLNLFEAEQLRTWTTEGLVKPTSLGEPNKNAPFKKQYQINVLISDFDNTLDKQTKLDAGLCWWLGIYDTTTAKNGFGFEASINNKNTVNLWLGIPVEEKYVWHNDKNAYIACTKPYLHDDSTTEIPAYLRGAGQEIKITEALRV